MTDTLFARDLSPIDGQLNAEDDAWLQQLESISASDHLLRFGDAAAGDDDEDFIVTRDSRGWSAGRYIGDIRLGGRRLIIRPRLGELAIEQWLADILNLVAVPDTSAAQDSEAFLARLMGAVWCRAVDQASRHTPPSLRRPHEHRGPFVRGRLDVRATARLRAGGSPNVASIQSYRDLDNDVSRTLVAAERALSARIGHRRWLTPRVDEMLPALRASVGSRPRLPSTQDLARIRYTPITAPYRTVATLSRRLAQLQGYSASDAEGRSEGLLVDVAELWELFVLRAIVEAVPRLRVEHGTHAFQSTYLLSSISDPTSAGLGRLKPDVLAFDRDSPVLIVDAKYKRLAYRRDRTNGVDRADLYQLTSYMARYSPTGQAVGMLLYPRDPEATEVSTAEAKGPWQLPEDRGQLHFRRISVELREAVVELREILASAAADHEPVSVSP